MPNLKRKRLSGCQYKKNAIAKSEKKEQLNRKNAKLDTYFKLKVSVYYIIIIVSIEFLKNDYLILPINAY